MKFLQSGLGRTLLGIVMVGTGYGTYHWWHGNPTSSTPSLVFSPVQAQPAVYTPQATGQQVPFDFIVRSAYKTKGPLLLNNSADYQAPGAQCLVIHTSSPVYKQLGVSVQDPSTLVGHHVKGVGKASEYKGRPQIVVEQIAFDTQKK